VTVWTLAFPARVWSVDAHDAHKPVSVNVLIESDSPGEAARDLGDVLRTLVRQAQVPSKRVLCPTCGLALANDGSCAYCLSADVRALGRSVEEHEHYEPETFYPAELDVRVEPSQEPTCGQCTKGQWLWANRTPAEKEADVAWCEPQADYRHVNDKIAQAGADGKRCPHFSRLTPGCLEPEAKP